MTGAQGCPLCGEDAVALVKVEGYELSCPRCLASAVDYHMANVHDQDCGSACLRQRAAASAAQRAFSQRFVMLVRRPPGGGHDEVICRVAFPADAALLGDQLKARGLTPAVLGEGVTELGRGSDGAEYEAVRL